MPNPRRRRSKAKRDRMRAHKKLKPAALVKCDHCGELKPPHRLCPECGTYRGRAYRTVVTS